MNSDSGSGYAPVGHAKLPLAERVSEASLKKFRSNSSLARDRNRKELERPDWLPENVWPFETFGLNIHDIPLAVTDVGTGPTLLFVHTGGWSFIWRDLMTQLARGFRCVCFDAPGTGRSSSLPQSEITLSRASAAMVAIVEKLALDEFTLVAHDLGGVSSLSAAGTMPERVRGIVAMNTFGWQPDRPVFRGMLRMMGSSFIRELDALTNFMSLIGSSSFGAGRNFDAASRRAFREGSARGARRAFHSYMQDARRCDALYRQIEAALAGPLATRPLLTIFGERNDPFRFQQRWKGLFPGAVQVVVAGGHHFPMCDAPDFVANAIRSWHTAQVIR